MPLSGDLQALRGFEKKLAKFSDAGRRIAVAVSPKVAGLVAETFSAQADPFGRAWVRTRSGKPAFQGSSAQLRTLSRLAGKSSIRTTLLYPLHFHQDGTHRVGRKRSRAIMRKLRGGYVKSVLRQMGVSGAAPRRRKGESDSAYEARIAKFAIAKQVRQEALKSAKRHAAAAVEEARSAGGWHDPPRPMIPDAGDPIPPKWSEKITETARPILAEIGAVAK